MNEEMFSVDTVVIGAGMAGLTISARLVQLGQTVALLESSAQLGGSAALSEGYVWTAPTEEVFRHQDPSGDLERFRRMRQAVEPSFEWLEELSVPLGTPLTAVLGFGEGRQVDIGAYISRCATIIEASGSFILRDTPVSSLLCDENGEVIGVSFTETAGEDSQIRADAVVIATGGFQANPGLRAQLMGDWARDLVLRSNPHSLGAGVAMAREAGAGLAGSVEGFYGHLVPHPLDSFEPKDFAALAQYFSEHGLLLDAQGCRFTDESLGDHVNTEEVARIGRAVLIVDERIRRSEVMRPFIAGMDAIDKMAAGGARGANYATAESLEKLVESVAAWGYDPASALQTINDFNTAIAEDAPLAVPRRSLRSQLTEPPYAAIEVEAAITFTYLGLASDLDGRVLDNSGEIIRGLYVAGADLGGLNNRGYTGGLVRGLTLGRLTADAIISDGEKLGVERG